MVNKRPIKWLKNIENFHASLWEYCRGLEHQSHNMLEVNGKKTKNKTKDKRQEHNTIILQMKHVIIKSQESAKWLSKGCRYHCIWLIYKKKKSAFTFSWLALRDPLKRRRPQSPFGLVMTSLTLVYLMNGLMSVFLTNPNYGSNWTMHYFA